MNDNNFYLICSVCGNACNHPFCASGKTFGYCELCKRTTELKTVCLNDDLFSVVTNIQKNEVTIPAIDPGARSTLQNSL